MKIKTQWQLPPQHNFQAYQRDHQVCCMKKLQFQKQFLAVPPLICKQTNVQQYSNFATSPMYYFLIPTLLAPQDFNLLLPISQFASSQTNQQIEMEKAKLDHSPSFRSQTVSKLVKPIIISQNASKIQKSSQKLKNCINDEDYCPQGSAGARTKKMPQLQNRNVVPNAVRLILSFIQKKDKSGLLVTKLFERYGLQDNWSLKRFYFYQGLVKSKLNNYVNEQTVKKLARMHPESYQLIGPDEQRFYNKIARILVNYYLRDQFLCSVLTSKRMDKTKTRLHLSVLRNIRSKLRMLLEEQANDF